MNNKNIKMMFLLFSLLILLFGTVSAEDTAGDNETSCTSDTIQDTDSSANIVPYDKIPEKNEKIINDKTNTKTSNRIPTKITIDPIETTQYTDNVTISGKYRDITGRILRYTPLNVKINTNSYRIQTDVNGNFKEKFRTNTIGTNTVTINYYGNINFEGNTTTETFTVTRQDTKIRINPIETVEYTDYTTITGKYTDKNGVNLRYTPITLNINGNKYTTTTNNYGEYTFDYKTNKVGYNIVTASYPGNTRYYGTEYSTDFYVVTKSTIINLDPIESKSVASIIRFTGDFEDNNGNKLRFTPLNIDINGLKYTTKTDYNGEFALNYQTRDSGENKIVLSYSGNARYGAAMTESTFEVTKKATKIGFYPESYVQYTDNAYISGLFMDCDENPLRYTTLTLNINGKNYYTKTDDYGHYAYDYKTNKIGINNVTVSFPGNKRYKSQSSSSTFIVTPKDTILTINPDYESNPISDNEHSTMTIYGMFTDSNGNPLRYTPLQIDVDGKKYTTQTDFYGKYIFSYESNSIDDNQVTVSYSGNARYYGTSVKESYIQRPTQIYLDYITKPLVDDYIDIKGHVENHEKYYLINIPVSVTVNGEKYYTTVNDDGIFNLRYKVKKSGVNNISATYDGNYKFASSSKTIRFIAERIPTIIRIANTVKNPYNNYITIKGQFYDYKGNMLRYTPLTLNIDGVKYTTQTDSNGLFTFYYYGDSSIEHSLIASYDGNNKYDETGTRIFFKAQTTEDTIEILTPHTKEYYYENEQYVLCKENYEDISLWDTVNLGSDIIYGFTLYVEGQSMPGARVEQNGLIIEEAPANTITNVEFYFKNNYGDIITFDISNSEYYPENTFETKLIEGYIPYKAVITYRPKTPAEIRKFYEGFDYSDYNMYG